MVKAANERKGLVKGGRILSRFLLMFAPFPKNTFCSIDVTSKCNLRCKHCYFFSYDQEKQKELTDEEWLARIKTMQEGPRPFYSCTWVGGEPLLRKGLIEKGRHYFKANRVVTNGTLPLPDWPDVEFHISVDGTEKLHDAIRGDGVYRKIKKTISDPNVANLKVAIACCLHRDNAHCIEDLLKEWKEVPHVRHILFDFFTPIKGVKEDLWLNFKERDDVLNKLKELKNEKYGSFIGGPAQTFKLMNSQNKHKAVGANCVFVNHGTAFDSYGNIKKPCVIGSKADCERCGCIVPFSVKAWKHPANLLKEIWYEIKS
jgi:MoaA/NifB/PqqE/SkfB family radical SAM enzyme